MTSRAQQLVAGLILAVFVAGGTGYLIGGSKIPDTVTVSVPSPSPYPVPSPFVPAACVRTIDTLKAALHARLQFAADVYSAYLDYPGDTLTDFGRRVEAVIAADTNVPEYPEADAAECKAAQ